MTAEQISAAANETMARIAERVRLRDLLEQSLAERLTPGQRRAVQDRCGQLTKLNRADQRRLRDLDANWEALMRRGCADVAA